MSAHHLRHAVLALATLALAATAAAADFKSVGANAAILYDAPSAKAKRLYIVNRGYPLEVTVQLEGWTKVRDANGSFCWIEGKDLADRRTVIANAPLVPVRQAPDEKSPLVFEAQQSVVLDVVNADTPGWLQVRAEDGASGYVKAALVWGS
jgi:SH3-like domain-containing protein